MVAVLFYTKNRLSYFRGPFQAYGHADNRKISVEIPEFNAQIAESGGETGFSALSMPYNYSASSPLGFVKPESVSRTHPEPVEPSLAPMYQFNVIIQSDLMGCSVGKF